MRVRILCFTFLFSLVLGSGGGVVGSAVWFVGWVGGIGSGVGREAVSGEDGLGIV